MGAVQASLPTSGSSLGAAASPPQLAIPGDLRVAQALGPAPPTSLGAPRGSGPALPGPLCLLPRDALEGWVREGWGDALGGGGPHATMSKALLCALLILSHSIFTKALQRKAPYY